MTPEPTATKTLEATLAPPTAHKERRLQRTVATYRQALEDAFESGADTQSAVNEVVTPYTLTSYAKDALKSYVPKLRDTYNASELDDDHPVRFTNRGFRIDHSEDRRHEFCWRVPQAGRGNAFWIPLRINPDQRELWADLFDGELSPGEFRLQRNRTNWVLHVTVEYEIEPVQIPDDPTPVGFDIGESKLLTGCALTENGTPKEPFLFDGSRARHLRKEMHTTLKRLQERDCAEWRRDERFDYYQNALTDIVEKASRQAIDYTQQFDDPVIVLEDLSYIRENLDCGKYMNRRLHGWAFARLTDRIEDKAADTGIPVRFVNPAYTSKTCHACNHIGRRDSQAEFRCTNSECWVTEYQADVNAAANIAGRLDPWGESLPWKPAGDDSPQDRSGCDTATGHHTPSPKPGQTTLVAFQS
ncbi:transposase [Halohasta litorea]|uniref:RNA-guided endonuclease TnpB family protein n=1 Tax=Halohasta litorea TaxID=869891 RepID=A0ABD6D3S9_9EURY|nr:transposase [Halohasta litorea]